MTSAVGEQLLAERQLTRRNKAGTNIACSLLSTDHSDFTREYKTAISLWTEYDAVSRADFNAQRQTEDGTVVNGTEDAEDPTRLEGVTTRAVNVLADAVSTAHATKTVFFVGRLRYSDQRKDRK